MLAADVGTSTSIATAVIGAVVAILGVAGYQSRRARLSLIRSAFNDVVAALASDDNEQRLAGAVLLRRFFDDRSELGVQSVFGRRRSPYAEEARSVMAAVLRGLPTGHLQKLLADGLAHAGNLDGADLQGTNLQRALLSPRSDRSSFAEADFYRADLSGATLRDVYAPGAVFFDARLRHTVFRNADLRGANFFAADLTGANLKGAHLQAANFGKANLTGALFEGAQLDGADFSDATNVPAELAQHIVAEGRYQSQAPAPAAPGDAVRTAKVFVSAPSNRSAAQQSIYDRVLELLGRQGLEPEILQREDYPPSDAMGEIFRRMNGCAGVLVIGFESRQSTADGSSDTSPWTHLETGMAYASDLPVLTIRPAGVRSGAFDPVVVGHRTYAFDLGDDWDDPEAQRAILPWVADVTRN